VLGPDFVALLITDRCIQNVVLNGQNSEHDLEWADGSLLRFPGREGVEPLGRVTLKENLPCWLHMSRSGCEQGTPQVIIGGVDQMAPEENEIEPPIDGKVLDRSYTPTEPSGRA
jgi:hypothetical protein